MARMPELMKCGCVANSYHVVDGKRLPACVVHIGLHPGAEIVDENPPTLLGRKARCHYYDKQPFRASTIYPQGTVCPVDGKCMCEVDSDYDLPFFEIHPDKDRDEYYCGCHGWD